MMENASYLKIGLIGAHGVGKTTLARFLKKKVTKIKDVSMTPEVPRVICESLNDPVYFRRGNNNPLKQGLILFGQLCKENSINDKSHEILICDRTVLDHWAYSIALFESDFSQSNIRTTYELFIREYMGSYDHIFYVPIEFSPEDDGTRESDIDFQHRVDTIIKSYLDDFKLKFLTIRGTVDERANQILTHLEIK